MSSRIQIRWFCGSALIFVTIYIDKISCRYTNSLEQKTEDCSRLGSVCGGHSSSSCTLFCVHRGHISGRCEQNCCTCYNNSDENLDASILPGLADDKLPTKEKFNNVGLQTNRLVPHLQQKVCTTPACIKAANQLKENMDLEVDPCSNFYEFACGNFIKRTKIPNDKSRVTMFTKEEEKVEHQIRGLLTEPVKEWEPRAFRLAKQFYKSCMDTDLIERLGTEPLKKVLENVGGWPVIEDELWSSEKFHWIDSSIRSRRVGLFGDVFVKIDVSRDVLDSSRKLITIGEPNFEIAPDVLLRGLRDLRVRAYYKYQVDMAVLLGSHRLAAERDMLDVLEFEQSLANILSLEERRLANSFFKPISMSQLELQFPSVNWLNYIQSLVSDTVDIDSQERIVVKSTKYVEGLLNLLAVTPYRSLIYQNYIVSLDFNNSLGDQFPTQSNYVGWKIVASSAIYLNEESRHIYSQYAAVSGKDPLTHSRSSECVETCLRTMGSAVGSLYIRQYFNGEMKASVKEVVNVVRSAFSESLSETAWMDARTLETAKEKAWTMHSHVGYPQEHLNDDALDAFYLKWQVKENSFFKNVLATTRLLKDQDFDGLKVPVNKTDWKTHGNNAVANAFYHSNENSIVLPAGILQGHFFGLGKPNYINYGSIGWIIGHEMSHGFDVNGHLYDQKGNYRNWWDRASKRAYERKTQCFVEQYANFEVGDAHLQLNGVSSQGENVADSVGIKQAYRGYMSWVRRNGHEKGLPGLEFSPNQLFWITAANNWCAKHRRESLQRLVTLGVHVPEEFRVIGAFSNSAEFASDFKCSKHSRMNPPRKCVLW